MFWEEFTFFLMSFSNWLGWISFIICVLLGMIFGYWLLTSFIVPDHDIRSRFTILLFCLTFSLSIMALGLFIFEIFKIGQSETRSKLWSFTLISNVLLLLYILPCLCIIFIGSKMGKKSRIFALIIIFLSICAHFKFFGIFYLFELNYSLQSQLDFITKIGTFMIGILSGFGAVNCPWAYFQMISLDINKVRLAKKDLADNIHFILSEIEKIGTKLALLNVENQKNQNHNQEGLFSKIKQTLFFWNKQPKSIQQKQDLKNELTQLKDIHKEFYDYYKDYTDEETRYNQSKSFYGMFLKRLAWIVLIYCIYKMIMSTINSIWGRKKSIDPINRILKVILPFFGFQLDQDTYETLAMYGTFIFMGYLMFSNVRSFSLNLVNIFNTFMGVALLQRLPSEIMVYFLAEVFGMYLLSTVILLQTSLPDSFINNLKEYSKDIEILSHYEQVDRLFLVSAFLSIAIIYTNYHRRKIKLEKFETTDKRLKD